MCIYSMTWTKQTSIIWRICIKMNFLIMTALICVLQDVRWPAEVLNGSLCAWGLNTGDHSHPLPQCLQSLQSSHWSLSITWVVYHWFDKPLQSRSFLTCTNGLFSISLVGCYCLPPSSRFCPSCHCCHCLIVVILHVI